MMTLCLLAALAFTLPVYAEQVEVYQLVETRIPFDLVSRRLPH